MSSSKRYGVYFNNGQDVIHTSDVEYEKQAVGDTTILFVVFKKWDGEKVKMPIHNVTYLTEKP